MINLGKVLFLIIALEVFLLCFPLVHVHGAHFALWGSGEPVDKLFSVFEMIRNEPDSGGAMTALFVVTVVVFPLFYLLSSRFIRMPFNVWSRILFVFLGLIALLHTLIISFILTFEILGPSRYLTLTSEVLLFVAAIMGVLLITTGVMTKWFSTFFRKRNDQPEITASHRSDSPE